MALIIICLLFVKPYIGMADNGDFFREIHNVGIYDLTTTFEDRHFGYFTRLFGIRQFPYELNTTFISSLSLVIRVALTLDLWLTADNIFDVRMMGVIYTVLFLLAFYMLLKQLTERMKAPLVAITAAISIFIFGDIGYIAYFNSFYGEPASYVFLFLTLAFMFKLLRTSKPSVSNFILFFVCASFFVAAKQQNAPVAILIAIVSVRFFFLRKDKLWRSTVITATTLLIALGGFVFGSITDDIKHINQYHALTRGILADSINPERDVKELGLDPKYSLLGGTTYYDKYVVEPPESDQMNKEFYSKFGYTSIIKYYVLHPDRAFEKLDLAAKNAFAIRPQVIGNYEKAAGKLEGQKAALWSGWSTVKLVIFPKNFKFIVFFYAIYYAGLVRIYVQRLRSKDTKGMISLEVFGLIGLIGLAQFGASFLGAGDADMAKHLFLFDVCYDFMFVVILVNFIDALYVKLKVGERVNLPWEKPRNSISG
ncbi:hypothetical protein FU659_31440 [Paenibacillus sp. N3.4]|nr:hypothetical protein FU659_31440 [Paenibacillus sp. N3.4]